jgi:hypothetical protein
LGYTYPAGGALSGSPLRAAGLQRLRKRRQPLVTPNTLVASAGVWVSPLLPLGWTTSLDRLRRALGANLAPLVRRGRTVRPRGDTEQSFKETGWAPHLPPIRHRRRNLLPETLCVSYLTGSLLSTPPLLSSMSETITGRKISSGTSNSSPVSESTSTLT